MKKILLFLMLFILFSGMSILTVKGDPYINKDLTDNTVNYRGWTFITFENLTHEIIYTLIVGNNTQDVFNQSWKSRDFFNITVYFNYSGTLKTPDNEPLEQLELILVETGENGDKIVLTTYMNFQPEEIDEIDELVKDVSDFIVLIIGFSFLIVFFIFLANQIR